jgi:hypothetical protein
MKINLKEIHSNKKIMIHQIFISDRTDPNEDAQLEKNKVMFENFYLEHEYKLWRNDEILEFISKNYPNLKCYYNKLQAYSSKSDLARLLIVNHFGGWYYDFYTEPIMNIDVSEKEMVFFRDIQGNSDTSFAVAPGIFYSVKNNLILQTAIDLTLKNIDTLYYGGNPLCPTGPVQFGRAIAIHGYNSGHLIGNHRDLNGKRIFDIFDNEVFANGKQLPGGEMSLLGTNNYNTFWHEKNFYGEKKRERKK